MGRGRNPETWAGQEWAMDSNGKWRLWHNAPPGLSPLTGQLPKHPGQRDKSLARVCTGEGPPRTNIKEATKAKAPPATGHVTLEEKLQERRATMRSALRPFGIGIVRENRCTMPPTKARPFRAGKAWPP